MQDEATTRATLRSRLEQFRRNILCAMELCRATEPEQVLQTACDALGRSDFVHSARAYLLAGETLTCVSPPKPRESLPMSREDHPVIRALAAKLVSNCRADGYIDFAAALGGPPGPTGVLHAVLTHEDLDAQLLMRHLFQTVSDRLRLLQGLPQQGLTATAPREPTHRAAHADLLATIVHEINNPLASILAHLEVLRMDRGGDPVVASHLDVLVPQVERLAAILNTARSFGDTAADAIGPVNVGEMLRAIVELVKHLYRASDVAFQLDIPQDVPSISGSAARLQQVWLNYFNNAFRAICKKGSAGGCICAKARHDKKLRQLIIEIIDDGVGMDARVLDILRNPSQAAPRAAGIRGTGTTEAARIIAQHKGSVDFTSQAGRGTTVRVVLPVQEPDPTAPL